LLPRIPCSISHWIVRNAAQRAVPSESVPLSAKKAAQQKKTDSWESLAAIHTKYLEVLNLEVLNRYQSAPSHPEVPVVLEDLLAPEVLVHLDLQCHQIGRASCRERVFATV
jgi:hypothetical protein